MHPFSKLAGRAEKPDDKLSEKKADLPRGTETTEDAEQMENGENKQKEGDMEESSESEKPRKEADQYRAAERKENPKVAGKKVMKKPEKECMKKEKKGTEKKENLKKGADLQGTKGERE